jgi:hypothetical protein
MKIWAMLYSSEVSFTWNPGTYQLLVLILILRETYTRVIWKVAAVYLGN